VNNGVTDNFTSLEFGGYKSWTIVHSFTSTRYHS